MKHAPYPKPAPAAHDIDDLIKYRWSPRSFSKQQISVGQQAQLFEAARWSASCFNDQPWYFIVAEQQHQASFNKMLDCLMDANHGWAQHASLLVMSVVRTNFQHNNEPNRHAYHDMGIAMADLTLQATAMGIGIHQMAGFHMDAAIKTYRLPEGFEPVVISALGFPDAPENLPENLAEREKQERERKTLSEFVFVDNWGSAKFDE